MNFQTRVWLWVLGTFGVSHSLDKHQRACRFLEEALELAQASGVSEEEVGILTKYTYGRPVGSFDSEAGGVMVTLSALCSAHEKDLMDIAEEELLRNWERQPQIRAKQAAKLEGPLPGGIN